ncbi:MAG: DNA polymerase I [Candidatus Omnitrophica bacterium]|nr:DNA polymerase I [Candidatus Omnitrophota bacterium]MDD5518061.1 DNA polymerase I [Candidatus Omnitrophota bacterium]
MDKKRLYLIDATAFCYRAFYAVRGLSTSFGQPTGAIYGFLNLLNKVLKDNKPGYLAVCFDVSRDTFRAKKFAEYKIQRPPMPDDLVSQVPLIKKIVSNYGIKILEKAGFEADDIIATLARAAQAKGVSTLIISSDKDILQLVNKDIEVYSPHKDTGIVYDEQAVFERFGVRPQQVADVISLMGDTADNIPGIPGIGEKTAVELVKEFGSLEKLLSGLDKVKKEKIRGALKENIKQARLNKELVELTQDIGIDFNLAELEVGQANQEELARLFKHLEFNKFLKGLNLESRPASEAAAESWDEKDLKGFMESGGELFLYGENADSLVFGHAGKFLRLAKDKPGFRDILVNPKINKISHDLKKIKTSLAKENFILEGLCFDTMIAAYLLNPSKGSYALENVALDYLDKFPYGKLPAGREALDIIKNLKAKLSEELKKKKLEGLFYDTEMPLVDVLSAMEGFGVKIDLKLLKSLSQELGKRLTSLVEDIYKLSGTEFNINSPKQLRVVLFEQLKLPVVKKTKTGASTDEEVLKKLADKHELPAFLLEYRQLTKLKTTYIDVLPQLADEDSARLHTSFNQTGTETGRLSSSNPNLQNIPIKTDIGAKIRKAIIAGSKDNYLISGDYSQIDLRILAHLSGDEHLSTAFKKGMDIHKATAALIYGVEEKEVSDEMRDRAKRVNFGIVYGLSSYGLARDLNVGFDEAQSFIDAYFARYSGVKEYIEKQIKLAQKEGFVTTILGRRRYLPEINSKNQGVRQFAERQAVNTPIQGSAADLIKLAMISIDKEIKRKELKSRMVLQIHDELLFDLPKDELQDLITLARDRMENVLKLNVPVRVDIKKGYNWLEMEKVK